MAGDVEGSRAGLIDEDCVEMQKVIVVNRLVADGYLTSRGGIGFKLRIVY